MQTYLADRALDITDDGSVWVIDEFYSNLGNVTGVAGSTEHLVDLGELDWLIL